MIVYNASFVIGRHTQSEPKRVLNVSFTANLIKFYFCPNLFVFIAIKPTYMYKVKVKCTTGGKYKSEADSELRIFVGKGEIACHIQFPLISQ